MIKQLPEEVKAARLEQMRQGALPPGMTTPGSGGSHATGQYL